MLFGVGAVVMLAALFTWNFSRENRTGTSSSSSQTIASTSLQTGRDLSGDIIIIDNLTIKSHLR